MFLLLTEDAVRERYDVLLRASAVERRAAQQHKVVRTLRRVEKARKQLSRALEEAYALPARPNPVTGTDRVPTDHAADRGRETRERETLTM